jgi:hypothetical protein
MLWIRAHVAALGLLAFALLATAGAFMFARPHAHASVLPRQPHEPLPYSKVTYNATDAQRAFRTADITLVRHTHEPVPVGEPPIVDLGSRRGTVEVDVFGNPQRVAASGFSDYFIMKNGHWLKAPKTCSPGAQAAEQWRGNLRVIVSCTKAGASASTWLASVDRALARLR